jgi:hypothetical protein
MSADDIHDFMIIWMDEIWDSLPSEKDKDDYIIAENIHRLQTELEKNNQAFFDEICAKADAVIKALKFQYNPQNNDSESSEDEEEEGEGMEEEGEAFDRQAKFEEEFAKAQEKKKIEIEKDYLPKFEADEDEEWHTA